MDLGLHGLTDDQLLELVQEVCLELTSRDPYIRNMAQATITTASEKLALRRAAIKEAVTKQMGLYIESIRKEATADVAKAVKDGSLRLLTSEQEAKVTVDAALAAQIALIDSVISKIGHSDADDSDPDPDNVNPLDYAAWSKMRDRQEADEFTKRAAKP